MPKVKKEIPKPEPKKKRESPISLYPLTFEEAMRKLLVSPDQKTEKK